MCKTYVAFFLIILSRGEQSAPLCSHLLPLLDSFLKKILLIYLWLCWVFVAARSFSSCCERGLLFVAVCGLLIAVASLVAEHGL